MVNNKQRIVALRGKTLLTCRACKKKFYRPNAHIRNSTHSCSRKCAEIVKKRKPKKFTKHKCAECGKEFKRRLGFGGTKTYCSNKCRAVGNGKFFRGENHPKWKGGVSDRPAWIRRICRNHVKSIGKCEKCGSTEALQAHHILPYSKYPELRSDIKNLMILCCDCHSEKHPQHKNALLAHKKLYQI